MASKQSLTILEKIEILRFVSDKVYSYKAAANVFNIKQPGRLPDGYSTVAKENSYFNAT